LKPEAWNKERAESFQNTDTVSAYQYRAPYPAETFEILSGLIADRPRTVLDAGCGRGEIARNLVERVNRVDAVDFSLPMIESGKKLPHGNHPNINWIHGKAEDATLNPPYSLITAGHSLHWLDWETVMPRFATMLTPDGYLAVVGNVFSPPVWEEELRALRVKYAGYSFLKPFDLGKELEKAGLFKRKGERETASVIYSNSRDAYVEQFHSRSDMARITMGEEAAAGFDNDLRELLAEYVEGDMVEVTLHARITWGKPKA